MTLLDYPFWVQVSYAICSPVVCGFLNYALLKIVFREEGKS
jgi:hypothetical protein